MVQELRNLNAICKSSKPGIYKQWIYKENCYLKMCNYMQKINYSIQDLNGEIKTMKCFSYKDIVFVISLVDWISEAFYKISSAVIDEIKKDFVFSKENEIDEARGYLKALRAFVVGHPLNTTQHKKYGLDGNWICVDIRTKDNHMSFFNNNHNYTLTYKGLFKITSDNDYYLYCYSDKDDNMKYFRFIGCNYSDIYNVARLYIDRLYEFDKFLSSKKKRLFEEGKK